MNTRILKANLLLFLAALVWGTTFVAQRVGMDHVGPLTYSGVRFALGALALSPLAWIGMKRGTRPVPELTGKWVPLWGTLLAGVLMCGGINLRQKGIVYTTAGKAAFITGLYVIIIPVLGLLRRNNPGAGVWTGAVFGACGMYLLSVREDFTLAPGDGWVLVCAFVWALQVMFLGYIAPRMNTYVPACGQALVCSLLSLVLALLFESPSLGAIWSAAAPIFYGGVMSVAVGFTLQVIAQKDSPPAHAAIILQIETLIGAVSGWAVLGETMGTRALTGAALMPGGMAAARFRELREDRHAREERRKMRVVRGE
jgi:drug/metabolite transporter (DMT)-like permease